MDGASGSIPDMSSLFLKGEESSQSDSKQAQGGWDDTNPTSLQRR